jgi:hypothetical protein
VDCGGDYPVHGAIFQDGIWVIIHWKLEGKYLGDSFEHGYDLIEVKPRIQRELWYNVYPYPNDTNIAFTKSEADLRAGESRIACVKITIDCEEGEGL